MVVSQIDGQDGVQHGKSKPQFWECNLVVVLASSMVGTTRQLKRDGKVVVIFKVNFKVRKPLPLAVSDLLILRLLIGPILGNAIPAPVERRCHRYQPMSITEYK